MAVSFTFSYNTNSGFSGSLVVARLPRMVLSTLGFSANVHRLTGFKETTMHLAVTLRASRLGEEFRDFSINFPTCYRLSQAFDYNRNSSAIFKVTFDAGSELYGVTMLLLVNDDIDWTGACNRMLAKDMAGY
ncbi:hypothetical protein ABOM_011032 [Aspergillus bombycis]|uniref:Uncharacterized protein n=1 Tax=Aspergillus bombycis TaxID=109264 RepID=A0A1F7ZMN8_9EURO|nr:hypothetical protein ABOM_011032 [Aspergillus bombycis]OGM40726.1 hypothetical protein ABOM_011032 [Aspergillus bombycis]